METGRTVIDDQFTDRFGVVFVPLDPDRHDLAPDRPSFAQPQGGDASKMAAVFIAAGPVQQENCAARSPPMPRNVSSRVVRGRPAIQSRIPKP